jgi:hypothetical protein
MRGSHPHPVPVPCSRPLPPRGGTSPWPHGWIQAKSRVSTREMYPYPAVMAQSPEGNDLCGVDVHILFLHSDDGGAVGES